MERERYVLITPVRNEERTIGETLRSVLSQTRLPEEWIIVDDGSTDRTKEIVETYARCASYLRLLRQASSGPRDFASAVRATQAGCAALRTNAYDFIGLLDGDVRFQSDYFENLIAGLRSDPGLGLTGGWVVDADSRGDHRSLQNMNEVAGAVQFFRRNCFESLGGLTAIPEGGWDAVTCVRARMNGFGTKTRPDLVVEHLKPRNAAYGNAFQRNVQLGLRDYVLGASPFLESFKCLIRLSEHPPIIASLSRMLGYLQAFIGHKDRCVPADVIQFARAEQRRRLFRLDFPFR